MDHKPTSDQQDKMDRLHELFRSYGYVIRSEPLPNFEALWLEGMESGLKAIWRTMDTIRRNYKTKGKSKRALALLHSMLPEPAWGIALLETK